MPVHRRQRKNQSKDDFGKRDIYARLMPFQATRPTEPRASAGRVARITAQNHVSVTVRFSTLPQHRVDRKDLAAPGCWIDDGQQSVELIQQVRRGDIAMSPVGYQSYSVGSALGSVPAIDATVFLNRISKKVIMKVIGIVENPSQGRGQDHTGGDMYGVVQARGSNTIVNQSPHVLVDGDYVYALMRPETVLVHGVTYSANAITGTGTSTGMHPDWNQKLVPQLIPLKTKDLKSLMNQIRSLIAQHLKEIWPKVDDNGNAIADPIKGKAGLTKWDEKKTYLEATFETEHLYLVPGIKEYASLEWHRHSLMTVWDQFTADSYKEGCAAVLKSIYDSANKCLQKYWETEVEDFKLLNDPASLSRLCGTSHPWILPVGLKTIEKLSRNLPKASNDLAGLEHVKSTDSYKTAHANTVKLRDVLTGTQDWIEASDISAFLQHSYVCRVTSPQSLPMSEFHCLR